MYALPTRREYNADEGAVIVVVESIPELPNDLSLIVGDALHNFRSALEYAWWQLTIKHLGRAPADNEASSIQFPIRKPGREFDGRGYTHWVGQKAVNIVEAAQPPKAWDHTVVTQPPPFIPPTLGALRYLSNIDKHRVLNVTYLMMDTLEVRNPSPSTGSRMSWATVGSWTLSVSLLQCG